MNNKVALIIGTTGQDGSYLAELLLEKGYIVHGIVRRSSTFNTKRIDHLYNSDAFGKTFFTHHGDITDSNALSSLINKLQPNEIYNLAAQSHVKVSFEIPQYTAQVDALGTLNVLDAVLNYCPTAKLYQASTSELFGGLPEEMPKDGFNETTPFHPRSPYGVAKCYAYWITRNYREAYNLFTCNGLLFNHESRRRGETFVTRKITMWFAEYYKAKHYNQIIKPLQIGNIDSYRDWGHAKDYVEAMHLILQQDKPDDFVISTGETHTVREFIEACFHLRGMYVQWYGEGIDEVGMCNGEVVIKINPKYFRPSEVPYLLGDNSKARRILKWKPKTSFMELVEDMIRGDFSENLIDYDTGDVL